jgi:hypothetical protein
MKNLRSIMLIALISVTAGFLWDILVWRLHFPYFSIHWLVRLLDADGEAAYTSMMYETMILFFVTFLLLWIAKELRIRR